MDFEQQARELFFGALERSADERKAYLDANCADEKLRTRVESLLDHHARAQSFLATGSTETGGKSESLPFEEIGDFEILREIGRGGVGVVYLARERGLRRQVALKVLLPQFTLSATTKARFENEARVAASLNHDAIVPIHRFGNQDGIQYIASDYVEGRTLAEELKYTAGRGEPPLWKDAKGAAKLLIPIAEALEHAHHHHVIHRDVKPSNIFLSKEGRPYLGDFGLAKDLREEALTVTGDFVGTYMYMSPEQAMAERVEIDHRTDVFSLGIVLYEMICGQRPFDGDSNKEILHAIAFKNPEPLSSVSQHVSRDIETICAKAMEKRPDDRYQSARQMANDLRRYVAGEPIKARQRSWANKAWRSVRKQGMAAVFAILFGATAAGTGSYFYYDRNYSGKIPIEVYSEPSGAEVLLREVDFSTGEFGEPQTIGIAPLEARVEPGYYRFTLRIDGRGFAELTRRIDAALLVEEHDRIEVRGTIRPTREVGSSMVEIPPSDFIGGLGRGDPNYPLMRFRTEGFLIDRLEVTNAQYRDFVLATDYSGPDWWGGDYDRAWDELPVVGVSWSDAVAYAEWRGKRLPTRLEWDRAARGLDGSEAPWGSMDVVVSDLSCAGIPVVQTSEPEQYRRRYIDSCCPVGSHPQDRSPDGLYDVFGSVSEMVDAVALIPSETIVEPNMGHRNAMSSNWLFVIPGQGMRAIAEVPADMPVLQMFVGFRCAKSLAPMSPGIVPATDPPLERSPDASR